MMHLKGVLVLEIEGAKIVLDSNWIAPREKAKAKELTPHELAAEKFQQQQHKLNMIEGGFDNG
jgi:hypothetical protein